MNKIKQWAIYRARLKKEYSEKGITTCEGCNSNWMLSFHHRHKRKYYLDWPEGLGEFNQTVLLCPQCHEDFEYDKESHTEFFNKVRGEE